MIILETQRLFLREMNMNDYDALYAVLADREIMQKNSKRSSYYVTDNGRQMIYAYNLSEYHNFGNEFC